MEQKIPDSCPSCNADLLISHMRCTACSTKIEGHFYLPVFLKLSDEEIAFLFNIVKTDSSPRRLGKLYNVSYPTMRKRIDQFKEKIMSLQQ